MQDLDSDEDALIPGEEFVFILDSGQQLPPPPEASPPGSSTYYQPPPPSSLPKPPVHWTCQAKTTATQPANPDSSMLGGKDDKLSPFQLRKMKKFQPHPEILASTKYVMLQNCTHKNPNFWATLSNTAIFAYNTKLRNN